MYLCMHASEELPLYSLDFSPRVIKEEAGGGEGEGAGREGHKGNDEKKTFPSKGKIKPFCMMGESI